MATVSNLRIEQGATFDQRITVADASGNPLHLAGYRAIAHLQTMQVYPYTVLTLNSDPDGGLTIEPDGQDGVIAIHIDAETTCNFDWSGDLPWDLFIIAPDGSTSQRLVTGVVRLDRAVAVHGLPGW